MEVHCPDLASGENLLWAGLAHSLHLQCPPGLSAGHVLKSGSPQAAPSQSLNVARVPELVLLANTGHSLWPAGAPGWPGCSQSCTSVVTSFSPLLLPSLFPFMESDCIIIWRFPCLSPLPHPYIFQRHFSQYIFSVYPNMCKEIVANAFQSLPSSPRG